MTWTCRGCDGFDRNTGGCPRCASMPREDWGLEPCEVCHTGNANPVLPAEVEIDDSVAKDGSSHLKVCRAHRDETLAEWATEDMEAAA